jgi:uncharacterized protein
MSTNDFCHVEYQSTDLDRSKAFFSGLFEDWSWGVWGDGSAMLTFSPSSGGLGGGIVKVDKVKSGASPTVFIQVDDVDLRMEKAVALGGSFSEPKILVTDLGWAATVYDPDGNGVNLFQPHIQK